MTQPDYIDAWLWKSKRAHYAGVSVTKPRYGTDDEYYQYDATGVCLSVINKLTGKGLTKRSELDPVRVRIPRWTILDEQGRTAPDRPDGAAEDKAERGSE